MPKKPAQHREPWTKREVAQLRSLARRGTPTREIAKTLGRTMYAVYQVASGRGSGSGPRPGRCRFSEPRLARAPSRGRRRPRGTRPPQMRLGPGRTGPTVRRGGQAGTVERTARALQPLAAGRRPRGGEAWAVQTWRG